MGAWRHNSGPCPEADASPNHPKKRKPDRSFLGPARGLYRGPKSTRLKASKGGYDLHQLSVTADMYVLTAWLTSNPGGRMRAMHLSHGTSRQNFHCLAFATTKSLNT